MIEFEGTHAELIAVNGLYAKLAKAQDLLQSQNATSLKPNEAIECEKLPQRVRSTRRISSVEKASVETYQKSAEKICQTKNYTIIDIYRNTESHKKKVIITFMTIFIRGFELAVFGVLFLPLFETLQHAYEHDDEEARHSGLVLVCVLNVVAGILTWALIALAGVLSGWSSECVVNDLQVRALRTQLSEDAAHFDEVSHATVATRISADANDAKAALDGRLVQVLNNTVGVVSTLILATIFCWQLGLLAIGLTILGVTSFVLLGARIHILTGRQTVEDLSEQIALCNSASFAIAQAYIFILDMCGFALGIHLLHEGSVSDKAVFVGTTMAAMAGWATVFSSQAFTDFIRASPAVNSLLQLVHSHTATDPSTGTKPEISGKVAVRHLNFAYPTRPKTNVLTNLNFNVGSGEAVALVGASGCGKSTIVQLLERFYAYKEGRIIVDESDIRSLSLAHLRSSMALVSQEPVLFRGSVFENVALGVEDATFEMVREACQQANAASFVEAFPNGYDTDVGEKGHGLSGGQKQRIAIARALIRKPKILLLDEATSALDHESEKIVDEALKSASEGRTSITIAHRLSTIQHSDHIFVISEGTIVEQGKHEELLALCGVYYRMVMAQTMHTD